MGEIKVNQEKYYCLLEDVSKLIDDLSNASSSDQQLTSRIKNHIEKEYKVRELMAEKQMLYKTYTDIKYEKPEFSKEVYKLYLAKKDQLENLRKEDI